MPENTSQKRVLIEKANRTMFAVLAGASALVVFSLFTSKGLFSLAQHRAVVIDAKNVAADQLEENDKAVGELIASFKAFEETPESVLGTNEKNSKIVLDALPPKYDFPALATSLEKILTEGGYTIDSITGIDNSLNEVDENSANPQPVEIPFTITVSGTFDQLKNLPADLERSIRPIHVTNFDLSGKVGEAKLVIEAKTYYKPGKNLDVRYKEVR
jgi:Tfp pilus assembly protein PilO